METFVEFDDVTFAYPSVEGDLDEDGRQVEAPNVFEHFSASLPKGLVSFIGQNGCGKSTLILLASGRLEPSTGKISILGKDLSVLDENSKNLVASVIFQNMEFESEDSVSSLLKQVYTNGKLSGSARAVEKDGDLLDEAIGVFELSEVLERPLARLSKGETQRVLLAFSILYGSDGIFMDEPLFALEERQKEAALAYLKKFVRKTGKSVYIAMHELDLSKKYAEQVLLFYPNRDMALGTPEEVLTDEELEKAYQIPAALLKKKEDMTREMLLNQK